MTVSVIKYFDSFGDHRRRSSRNAYKMLDIMRRL